MTKIGAGLRRYWIPLAALGIGVSVMLWGVLTPSYTRFVIVSWSTLDCAVRPDGNVVVLVGLRHLRDNMPIDKVLLTDDEGLRVLGAALWPSGTDISDLANPPSEFTVVSSRGWLELDAIESDGATLAVLVEVTDDPATASGLELVNSNEIVTHQRIALGFRVNGQTCSVEGTRRARLP